jgi:hypothetical protein
VEVKSDDERLLLLADTSNYCLLLITELFQVIKFGCAKKACFMHDI